MTAPTDILILGTGSFAARILFDLAATATAPLTVAVAGRNPDRLDWLRTAANARAHMFGRTVRCASARVDLLDADATAELLEACRPAVTVQAASLQSGAVISATGNAWAQLVAEGGLSATAVFQALLSMRVARALHSAHPAGRLINCCFPDVVNGLIAAAGLPIGCGIGNVAILAHAFTGALPEAERSSLRVLAHYQTIAPWRRPKQDRNGLALPRVWMADEELTDVLGRFAEVRLTPEPVIDISARRGMGRARARAERAARRLSRPARRERPRSRSAGRIEARGGGRLEYRFRGGQRPRRRAQPCPIYRQVVRPPAAGQPVAGGRFRRRRDRCGL
jgi:hypothetical protein